MDKLILVLRSRQDADTRLWNVEGGWFLFKEPKLVRFHIRPEEVEFELNFGASKDSEGMTVARGSLRSESLSCEHATDILLGMLGGQIAKPAEGEEPKAKYEFPDKAFFWVEYDDLFERAFVHCDSEIFRYPRKWYTPITREKAKELLSKRRFEELLRECRDAWDETRAFSELQGCGASKKEIESIERQHSPEAT